VGRAPVRRDPCLDDSHCRPACLAGDLRPFLDIHDHPAGIDAQNQLQQLDQFFAAWVEEAVASGPAEALRQNMEHQQIKKILAGDRPVLIFFRYGIKIPESDHAVFVFQVN
jgi:hypothetical protein